MFGLGFFCGFAAYAVINALCAPSEKDEGLYSLGSSVYDDFDIINAPWNNSY